MGKTKRGKLAEIFVKEAVERLIGDNALGVSRSGFAEVRLSALQLEMVVVTHQGVAVQSYPEPFG